METLLPYLLNFAYVAGFIGIWGIGGILTMLLVDWYLNNQDGWGTQYFIVAMIFWPALLPMTILGIVYDTLRAILKTTGRLLDRYY